jgi:tRNA pseudouridine38-40 synthase
VRLGRVGEELRLRNLRLAVEYDGTEFNGWQVQPGLRTVQGTLQEALSIVLGERVTVGGAGRTDAGCHARGQVANARTTSAVPCERVLRSLGGLLPPDVAVHEVREAPLAFDPRRGAVERRYEYRLLARPAPLWRRFAWYPGFVPERELLEAAVRPLAGEHDFRGFAGADPRRAGGHGHCRVLRLGWRAWEGGSLFEIAANRFLYHMVRNIVGTAVKVARGGLPLARVTMALESGERRLAGPTAPPQGVCLAGVLYLPELEAYAGARAERQPAGSGRLVP